MIKKNTIKRNKLMRKKQAILFFFVLFSLSSLAQNNGESLFKTNCASCHTVTTKKLVGPGLEGIQEKRGKDWLYKWIQNSQELIASGDKDAIAVFEEYNKLVMPPQAIQNDEIDLILEYISNPPVSANPVGLGGGSNESVKVVKETPTSVVVFALVVLLFIIVLLNNVYKSLYKIAASKK